MAITGTALVIEDQQMFREALVDDLKMLGLRADSAINGKEGYDTFQKGTYDIVVTDIKMPVWDGMKFLTELRATGSQTPVVLMTGFSDVPLDIAFAAGASAFIAKPPPPEILELEVKRLLTPLHNRLRNTASDSPSHHINGKNLVVKLGYGGVYVAEWDSVALAPGTVVSFDLTPNTDAEPQISGIGRVIWYRKFQTMTVPEAYGIEITSLSPDTIGPYLAWVERSHPISVIPNGDNKLGNKSA